MDEYIKRKAALQFVFDACAECMDACEEFDGIYADCNQCMLEGVKLELRDLPAADVRPVVRGKWVKHNATHVQKGGMYLECSCCHEYITVLGHVFAYCPNCGAMMEES